MKKILSLGVILLFVGLALAPYMVAKHSVEFIDKKIPVTLEVYRNDDIITHTVPISQNKLSKFMLVFKDIKQRIENITTKEETINIFNDAVIELDNFGLFPDTITIEEVQHMINNYYKIEESKIILNKNNSGDYGKNLFCFLAGESECMVFGPISIITFPLAVLWFANLLGGYDLSLILTLFWIIFWASFIFGLYNILPVGYLILINYVPLYDNCWLSIIGLRGIQRFSGPT